jgi:branched-chain amino acid aminotransferase
VLLGVTRRSVIELAEHDGRKVIEAPIRPEALESAAEAFLTGTSAHVLAIESVDERRIGEKAPGPVTRALSARFEEVVSGRDAAFAHWLAPVS